MNWFFFHRHRGTDWREYHTPTGGSLKAKYFHYAKVYSGPRFTLLYRRWLTDRDAFYLSTRTEWIVPVAAVILTAAAVGRLISARSPNPEPIHRRELAIMAAMVVPVLLVAALPPATLGTFSAGKRAGFAGSGPVASADDIASGELTLVEVAAAQTTPEGEPLEDPRQYSSGGGLTRRMTRIVIPVIIGVIVLAIVISAGVKIVEAGNRGVLLQFGAVDTTQSLPEGIHFVTPFRDNVIQLETRTHWKIKLRNLQRNSEKITLVTR